MKFTGERVIPGEVDPDLLNEHMARYRFAQRYSAGKVVLDAASGSGYGSAMLGENAKEVFGVDIAPEAVEYARRAYGSPHVHFSESDCLALPFPSGRFDLVVALEIIEHLDDPAALLKELHRVLNPTGTLIVSTPNRLYYTEERGEINPFHKHEFTFREFDAILQPLFAHRAILLENHVPGLLLTGPSAPVKALAPSGILQETASLDGRTDNRSEEEEANRAHYFVAVCSSQPLAPISPLFYLPTSGNVLREREAHIRRLSGHLAKADEETKRAVAELERTRAEADETRAGYERQVAELKKDLEVRSAWAANLDREILEKGARIVQLQEELKDMRDGYESKMQELHGLLDERTAWAQKLDQELTEKSAHLQQLREEFETKVQWTISLQKDVEESRAALGNLQREFEERSAWAQKLNSELQNCLHELQSLKDSRWYRYGQSLHLTPDPPSKSSRK